MPIIDYRAYYDAQSYGDIHVRYHTFSMRARLEKANGTAANQVSLLEDAKYGLFSTASPLLQHAVDSMDRWLTQLTADGSSRPRIDKIVAARPSGLEEGCRGPSGFIAQPLDRDPSSRCEQLFPSASFPREVAGAGVAADVIKCRLQRPVRSDYPPSRTRSGTPARDLPRRRLRLLQARHRPAAARRHLAYLPKVNRIRRLERVIMVPSQSRIDMLCNRLRVLERRTAPSRRTAPVVRDNGWR